MATILEGTPSEVDAELQPAKRLAWYEATYAVVIVTPRHGWQPQSADDVPPTDARETDLTADAAQAVARQFNTRAMIGRGGPERWAVVIPIECEACERPAFVVDSGECESEGGVK